MRIELTYDDLRFAHGQLLRRLRDLENELAHTDKREFRAMLGKDVSRLQRITDHFASLKRDEEVEEFV